MDDKNFKKLLDESLKPIKIDIHSLKTDVGTLKTTVSSLQTGLAQTNKEIKLIKKTQDQVVKDLGQLKPAVAYIETTVKGYADMYKINNDNMKKLEKRTEKLEQKAKIEPSPELILVGVQ